MKNKSIASIIFFLVLLFIVSTAVSAKTIAVIRKVKGDVSLYRDNKISQQKLKRGTRLLAGDKIVTDKKGYAAIIFIDDKLLV